MTEKIFSFNHKHYISDPEVLDSLGSRGLRIFELASIKAPIAPGFIILNRLLNEFGENAVPDDYFGTYISNIEAIMDKKFGDPDNPLLVKVVESPMLNLVDTLSTVHNVGLCDTTINGFSKYVGEDFAYHEYANMLQRILKMELSGKVTSSRRQKIEVFIEALQDASNKKKAIAAINTHRKLLPAGIYSNAYAQLMYVIQLFRSLFSTSDTRQDSCLMVQSMVFGNYDTNSGYGSYYTREIVTGKNGIHGEYFRNAFDSRHTTGAPIGKVPAAIHKELERIGQELENAFKEIRYVRFTVERGTLWIIDQLSVANRSTQAEIKALLDLEKRGAVDKAYVVKSVRPGRLSDILHPTLNLSSVAKYKRVTGGIAGAVGAAIGRVYFSTERLMNAHKRATQEGQDPNFILAMPATFAEDVKAIEVGRGVISSEGGYASHAPVVARSLGKVAMVYPKIKFGNGWIEIEGIKIKEGDYITVNVPYSDSPIIYLGKATLTESTPKDSGLLELLEIIQTFIGDFDVRANADQPKDAILARTFGAKGIGLCRTEHMFFHEKRINTFRSMIIAGGLQERLKALKKLGKMQTDDFYRLFKIMEGLPVTIRLLDAPLHEFLPHTQASMTEFISYFKKQYPNMSTAEIRNRCDLLEEFNPMLGHRGIRVAITYPEIYNMQVYAIFEAVYKLQQEGIDVKPEIMVPIIMTANELKTIRNGKRIEGKSIVGIHEIEAEARKAMKSNTPVEYKIGTMIELPAAALQADVVARYADFFSFGTNDLTQTTNGLSRDDFNNFFADYSEFDLLESNPFQILGPQVKELIALASERGRLTRPDLKLGLCGEHGAEPKNIPFAKEAGLDYVSCSPYGIPIAKLAIAQMNVEQM